MGTNAQILSTQIYSFLQGMGVTSGLDYGARLGNATETTPPVLFTGTGSAHFAQTRLALFAQTRPSLFA